MSRNKLAYYLYNTALIGVLPLLGGYFALSALRGGRSWGILRRQLALDLPSLGPRVGSPRVWVHAVSVGETVASQPVMTEIRKLAPDAELTLSTTTMTGQQIAEKSVPEADNIIYFPMDLAPSVARMLGFVRPQVFASMESEIWPNFLYHCSQRDIPVAIVNGIVSDRTYHWGRKFPWLYKWILSQVDVLVMQSEEDAERIVALGADRTRVSVAGNCKFDQLSDGLSDEDRLRWRSLLRLKNGEPVLVAGSTNPGEEEQVLDAYRSLRVQHGDLRLIIAPRQLNRSVAIKSMASELGFNSGLRSNASKLSGSEDVIILDTLGELASVYGIASVAFVGGSLIPKGGHNILQPVAQGCPVLFGPYMHKSRDLMRIVMESDVGFQVSGPADLADRVDSLLRNPDRLEDISAKANVLINANKGAARRCAEAIVGLCRR